MRGYGMVNENAVKSTLQGGTNWGQEVRIKGMQAPSQW